MFARPLVLTLSSLALIGAVEATTPVVTTVEAQSRPLARIRFVEMDRNNDGVITRQEWNGSARSFEVHDWNNDGRLSGEEVRVGAQRNTNWETADHNPNRWERTLSWTRTAFSNLDHNRDGRLTDNEWHFDRETFLRVDANRDRAITLAEYLGEGVEDLRGDNFDDIDNNNNGRIERAEWYGGANEFRALDRNNDGFLTRFEVAGSTASLDTWDEFNNLDYDRDGRLERPEWHWSNGSFQQRDTNRDGILSRAEFDRAGGSPANATQNTTIGTRTIRVNAQHRWVDTGLNVRAGDIVTIQASGQIRMSDDQGDLANPGGSVRGRTAPDAPILNQPAGALIAKIGDFSPMFVGGRSSVTVPVSGRLYLSVNDDHLPDNAGEFTVTVGIQNRTLH
jgi:Ca2+-binding EF-hand superfamily protein